MAKGSTSWSKRKDRGEHYVRVETYRVVVGEHSGSGHTDMAGTCSHREFLDGRYQDIVRADHGEQVLQQVIAAIRGAGRNKQFTAEQKRVAATVAAWREIPLNPELSRLGATADERGMDHYDGKSAKGFWLADVLWEDHRDTIRATDRAGNVLFSVQPPNRHEIGNNIRIHDVYRCGARVLYRYSNSFWRDVPEVVAELGEGGWLEVTTAGFIGRCTESRR